MTDKTVAKRYAKAIFTIGEEQGKSELFAQNIRDLKALIEENDEVRHMLENQSIESGQKKAAIKAILSDMEEMVRNFVCIVIDKGRAEFFVDMCTAYEGLVEAAADSVAATVTSAVPLTDDQLSRIEATFSDLMKLKVKAKAVVDPVLIGGVQVKVGDKLYDGTIASQMRQLNEKLKEQRC